jgi:hypothetical protein
MDRREGSRWGRPRSLLGCAIAILALAALIAPSIASAKKSKPPTTSTYLALGDSLAFGYSQQQYNEGELAGFEDPETFERGYVNDYYGSIRGEKNGVALVNDGCPGETSASMIGVALAKSLNENVGLKPALPVTGEAPCGYQEAWNALKKVGLGGPLHHPYVGKSQLQDALAMIATKQNVEKKPVTTVTLNIGANDQLHAVKAIEKEIEAKVKKFAEGEVRFKFIEPVVSKEITEKYIEPAVKKAVQEKYIEPAVQKELAEKYIEPAVLEKCEAKAFEKTGGTEPAFKEAVETCLATEGKKLGEEWAFEHKAELEEKGKKLGEEYAFEHAKELKEKGEVIGLEYYVAHKKELTEKGEVLGFEYFVAHKAELEAKGEEIGHKYAFEHHAALVEEAERKIAELAKGEGAYAGKSLFAQINSNIAGILFAIRHGSEFGGVDYAGKILFQGGYDPYGKLFKTQEEANAFVVAHGGLTGPWGEFDTFEKVHPSFNELLRSLNKQEKETVNGYGVCATNPELYFNPETVKEAERLQKLTNMTNGTKTGAKYNGPDIHATAAGYKQLAKEMVKCH